VVASCRSDLKCVASHWLALHLGEVSETFGFWFGLRDVVIWPRDQTVEHGNQLTKIGDETHCSQCRHARLCCTGDRHNNIELTERPDHGRHARNASNRTIEADFTNECEAFDRFR
jgi:hypothetical protein